ncbi:hypothetical protein JM18_008513 [Phytophthora kernoviae]|uniref:Annexin n=2 Tax=Phytophthora kernoviae TaxID=325452 RepID=A0A921V3G5_9STRA|nr:hypothetical protein JM18_008513 [Phytophthora kernoviae]
MGGAESTEMDSKKQQQQAVAGGKPTPTETGVKTVEGGVTTYTTTAGVKTAVSDFEAVSEQKSSKGPGAEPETEPSDRQKAAASGDDDVKTEVFRMVEADGCVVVKTVKTTRRSTVSTTGEPMTTVEVETTTETEDTNGDITTSTKTETTTETETPGELVMIEVFQSEEADGTIVTKTVKTTTRTSTTTNGELMTTVEVETTTETETKSGEKSTTVETETREETETEMSGLATTSGTTSSVSGMTAIRSSEQAGAAPGESVKTEVFQSEEADGTIVTKTVKTTTRTSTTTNGELMTTVEVETTTETETKSGEKSTTVETETREETETEMSGLATTSGTTSSVSGMTAIRSSEQAGAAPGESVKTEVFQSEEADGTIVTKTVKTTTRTSTTTNGELMTTVEVETTTETETKSGEKSTTVETTETTEETSEMTVTEEGISRGSDKVAGQKAAAIGVAGLATTGAVIGSAVSATRSKTTSDDVGSTETTETTETTEETSEMTVTEEGISRGSDKVAGQKAAAIGVAGLATTGAVIGSAVSATRSKTTSDDVGSTETTETTETTEETSEMTVTEEGISRGSDKVAGQKAAAIGVAGLATTGAVIGSAVSATRSKTTSDDVGSTETMEKGAVRVGGSLVKSYDNDAFVVVELSGDRKIGSKLMGAQDLVRSLSVMPQFVDFCGVRGQKPSNLEGHDLHELSSAFCAKNFSSFSENLYEDGSLDEKRAAWNFSRTLSVHVPELAVHQFGIEVGRHKRVLIIKEVSSDNEKASKAANIEVLTPLLNESPQLSSGYENVVITEGGKVVFYGSAKALMAVSEQLGLPHPQENEITGFLLGLSHNSNAQYHVTIIDGANDSQDNQRSENLSSQVNFADDTVLFASDSVMAPQATKKFAGDDTKLDHREDNQSSSYTASPTLVTAGTAAMRGLYVRHAREGSMSESMTFSADIDAAAQEIQRVCTGAATDEAALASLLLSKTVEERYLIWWRYRILYKQSLSVWVKSTSDYGVLLKMLSSPLEHVEAEILRKATKGLGTTEEWIYPVVMARSNVEIALLKKTFQEKYGEDLVKILSGELSGDLKKVILTAMRGEVAVFDASVHTSAKVTADVDALYKAGEGRMGTDETTFINILVLSPAEHVRNINSAYLAKYKTDIAGAIKQEFSGDAKLALLFLIRSVLEPVDLLAELFETTLKGANKNAYGLSAWVVRYYRLLVQIRIVYMRMYRQELRIRIQSVTSGEYCQLLLSILDAAEAEFGTSESAFVSESASASALSSVSTSATVSSESIGTSALVEEKSSTSATKSASVDSMTAVSAVSSIAAGSSALVTAGTAAMRGLYVRHAREGSMSESMTFSADIDAAAQEIQRVCTGAATDEAALASLLLSKTVEERYLIWWRYRILYKQSLSVWVKSTSDYGVLLKMLSSPLEHVEAEILRKATKGLGTTEEWIYPVVMARSNVEIALLKKTFQEKYGEDLVKILSGELSGDLKKVILTAMRGEVAVFDASVHTSAKVTADVDALYKAGEGKWGTDEEPFIRIVVLSPSEHLRNIDAAYSKKYKKTSVIKAIKGEFKGDAQAALLYHVRMVFEPFELLADLFESTMKGLGTDEYGLSAAVVRYHVMLPQVKTAYKKLYGKELSKRIRGDTSGEYRDLLLAIVDGQ